MADTILPEFLEADFSNVKVATQAKLLPAPLFDFEKGDFVRDAAGRVLYGDGREAWRQWCVKVISTERDSYVAYSTAIGVETEHATAQGTRSAVRSALERTITEALMVHPMTESVQSFEFVDQVDGSTTVTFTVTGINSAGFTVDMRFNVEG